MEPSTPQPVEVSRDIALSIAITAAVTLIIGYVFFRFEIFNFRMTSSQIPVNAFVGSIFFWLWRKINLKTGLASVLLLFLAEQALIIRSTKLTSMSSQILFFAALIFSIVLYDTYFSKMHRNIRPLILMFLMAFFSVAEVTIQFMILKIFNIGHYDFSFLYRTLFPQTVLGGLSGLGLGLGFLISGLILKEIKQKKETE
ncbi:MAG: hypothetical protein LWX07_08880 [Bacteroidetes bacterium]|nr:hypothetical protein [Bacteroidota bacterium]